LQAAYSLLKIFRNVHNTDFIRSEKLSDFGILICTDKESVSSPTNRFGQLCLWFVYKVGKYIIPNKNLV
jgi:hypothetical protein